MNSNSLRKEFSEVYKHFFLRNDLIFSGCFTFPWGHEGSGHKSNYINVKSKVPLKCFVGIKPRKDEKVIFSHFQSYNLISKQFEEDQFEHINKEAGKITQEISFFLKENGINTGVDIEILSESTRGHSFGFSGTMSAVLMTALFVYVGKIGHGVLDDYEGFKNLPVFQELHRHAWRLDFLSRYGNSSGENVMHTLDNSKEPSFLLCERFDANLPIDSLSVLYSNFTTIPDLFSDTIITRDLSMDYCLVFSGVPTETKKVEEFRRGSIRDFDKYKQFIAQRVLGDDGMSHDVYVKKYIQEKSLYANSSDIIGLLSIRTIDLFRQMFETGHNDDVIEGLIDNINSHRFMVSILEKQSEFANDFLYYFRKNQTHSSEKIGLLPAYSGKMGGGYVIVLKPEVSRETLRKTIDEMRGTYPGIELEYSSYLDGLSSDGIILEQHISGGCFSEYVIAGNNVFVWSNKGDYQLMDYKSVYETSFNGLLLDSINGRIYLNGAKLTSKDIPSQNSTIDVLLVLLERMGEDVLNTEFPLSSYSKNKNEMLGKIVLPIIKVVEEKMNDHFPLICKGSITEYYMKLNKTNIDIRVIKKA